MSNEKLPKFAEGDTVNVHDKFGIVIAVHEEMYFWQGGDTYYEYTVRFDDGSEHKYAESILDKRGTKKLLCECGAWAVDWSSNQHSRWCPAYKTFDRA